MQSAAMHVACCAEDVGIGADVERKRMAPHIARCEYLARVGDGNAGVLRQHGVLAARAADVEYLK